MSRDISHHAQHGVRDLILHARRHEHAAVHQRDAHAAVHGESLYGRVNTWLAVRITSFVGSMTCAWLFAALALVSLPAAVASRNPVILVSWISQTFLQLVLLSIIIVGQRVISEASDARADSDHETLTLLKDMNVTQLAILQELHQLAPPVTPPAP